MSVKQNSELKIADLSISGNEKSPKSEGGTESSTNFKVIEKTETKDRLELKPNNNTSSLQYGTRTGVSSLQSLERSETVVTDGPLYTVEHNRYLQSMSSYLLCLLGPEELVGNYWVIENNKDMFIGRNRKCDILYKTCLLVKNI